MDQNSPLCAVRSLGGVRSTERAIWKVRHLRQNSSHETPSAATPSLTCRLLFFSLGRCFAELLSTTISGSNQMLNFFPWIAAICMGLTVATQLHFLALALNYFDALYVVPVFQCTNTTNTAQHSTALALAASNWW